MIKYIVELVGTFIFLSVILKTGNPIAIAISLAAVIYFGGYVSGGHFNPAVSFMMYLHNKINIENMVIYIISQLIGAALAFYYVTFNNKLNHKQHYLKH